MRIKTHPFKSIPLPKPCSRYIDGITLKDYFELFKALVVSAENNIRSLSRNNKQYIANSRNIEKIKSVELKLI